MQSLKKIMEDMGFNPDAPTETQKAFIKHLIKAANESKPRPYTRDGQPNATKVESKTVAPTVTQTKMVEPQMSFDTSLLGTATTEAQPNKKRVS